MVYVSKKKGETKDSLFRKFSRMFMDEQIVEKLREIQFYKKPSRRRLEKERLRGGRPIGRVGKTKTSKTGVRKTR